MFPILLITFVFLLLPTNVFAKYDPRTVPNNKYGIHVADVNDIPDTAALVNSSGGDWGYVTLVMQDNDRDLGKWQKIFDQMRRLHLIPLVRLATHLEGSAWIKPTLESSREWATFLNSLNWPMENRYVILFNEPNHAKEWGNSMDPEGYAQILESFAVSLHDASSDFFILPAGLDASAVTNSDSLAIEAFLARMVASKPSVLDLIDGWASHSYPNPGFSGSPFAIGRGTVRSYLWELTYLYRLGLTKNLPVFVTETGWLHSQGTVFSPSLPTSEAVGANLLLAASSVWQDPTIVAVTPFVFSYQGLPFDHFSWKKLGSNEFYPHYFDYQNLSKVRGIPKQRHSFSIITPLLPDILVASSSYNLKITMKNTGQSIVGEKEGYALSLATPSGFEVIFDSIPTFEPGETVSIAAKLSTPSFVGTHQIKLSLHRGTEQFSIEEKSITIVPPPALSISLKLGWRGTSNAIDVTVLVYDEDTLIHKFTGLTVVDGNVEVSGLTDIIPGNRYRVVTLVPYYLPRQTTETLTSNVTAISFKRFLPLDFNRDGALTYKDLVSLAKSKPHDIIPRFFAP